MFELHGWARVAMSPGDDDDDTGEAVRDLARRLAARVEQCAWTIGILELRAVNGQFHLVVSTFRNRRDSYVDEAFGLFEFLAEEAPGSYGLLYLRDEDAPDSDGFEVCVLARGRLTRKTDPFLSPCVPVIEDAWDEIEDA